MTTASVLPHIPPAELAAAIDAAGQSGLPVRPEYMDWNGHMNLGYYGVLGTDAFDRIAGFLGLGAGMIARCSMSSFVVESHFTYQRELHTNDMLVFTTHIVDVDAKRLHYLMRLFHQRDGWLAATVEHMSICVDMTTRKSSLWPDDVATRLTGLLEIHRQRPQPQEAGRAIAIRRG